jgi:hypothetical protein
MKTHFQFIAAILAALVFAGCSASRADNPETATLEPAAHYKAGHGLRLSDAARDFIELETGEVTLLASSGDPAVLTIPAGALLRTVRGDFVFVDNGGWFLLTPVVATRSDGARVEISDGLYEGDVVVTRGVRKLALAEIQALNGGVGCADGH